MAKIDRHREVLAYSDEDNPWVTLFFDEVRFSDGRRGRYNRVLEGAGLPGVAILPASGGLVALIRIYRYPVNEELWEIPRGFTDAGETTAAAAQRELLEETGWAADKILSLGVIYPNSGLLASHVELFLAGISAMDVRAHDEEAERIEVFSWDEVIAMARDGAITDGFTISALFRTFTRRLMPMDRSHPGEV